MLILWVEYYLKAKHWNECQTNLNKLRLAMNYWSYWFDCEKNLFWKTFFKDFVKCLNWKKLDHWVKIKFYHWVSVSCDLLTKTKINVYSIQKRLK